MRRRATGLVLGAWLALVGALAWAQPATIEGAYGDGRVTLALRAVGGGQYVGTIEIDGTAYPLTATGSADRVDGTFEAGGAAYPFTATRTGDAVTLASGGATFALRRLADAPTPTPSAGTPAIGVGTRLSYEQVAVAHPGTNAAPGSPGSGARGVARFEVLHLDATLCVVEASVFLENATGTARTLAPQLGRVLVGRDGTCPEIWWPVERLTTYTAPPDGTQQVTRGPFQLPQGGASFDALSVRQELAGTRFHVVWDLATGVRLMATEGTGPLPAPAAVPTSSSTQTLLDARAVAYPWDVRAPLPPSVQQLQTLQVHGQVARAFVGVTIVGPQVERFDTALDVVERHPTLLLLRPRGGGADAFVALAPTGALFVPPGAAAGLRAGQRIDEDPVTGTVLSVERADADALVLAIDGPGLRIRRTFDAATGLLRSERIETNDGVEHVVYELTVAAAR